MSKDGIKEFGEQRRNRKVNTGKFTHDLEEGGITRDLNFKQRASQHESGVMAVAKKDVVTIPPTTTIMGAAKTMVGYGYRRLPIADAGTKRLKGICTVIDIIDFLGGGEKRRIIDRVYDGNMIVAINGPITEIMERDVVHIMGESTSGKLVKDIMSKHVITAPPDMSIENAAKTMISRGFRRLPVVSNGLVCGIITSTDIMRYLGNGDAFKKLVTGNINEAFSLPIGSIMKGNIVTIGPEKELSEVSRIMHQNHIG